MAGYRSDYFSGKLRYARKEMSKCNSDIGTFGAYLRLKLILGPKGCSLLIGAVSQRCLNKLFFTQFAGGVVRTRNCRARELDE